MRSLGLCRTSIHPWLRRPVRKGEAGLRARKSTGPQRKLTAPQQRKVRGRTAVGRLLASLESTPQKPLRRACERDPEAVAQWVRKDDPRLRRRARTVDATIFFLDEAGFSSEPALGRTDGLRGQTPVVATTGQRQKVSARSARSARGGFWSTADTGLLKATRFVEFLGDFRRGRREKIFLVVDGHPSHKARACHALCTSPLRMGQRPADKPAQGNALGHAWKPTKP